MNTERFDWDTHCGTTITPAQAVREANREGISIQAYARDYDAAIPTSGWDTPDDLIPGMVHAMRDAADELGIDDQDEDA